MVDSDKIVNTAEYKTDDDWPDDLSDIDRLDR